MGMNLAAALEQEPGAIDEEMQHAINEMAAGRHGDESLPIVAPPLSLAYVKPSFEQYVKKAELMVLSASKMEVTDEETNRIAVTLAGEAKKIAKLIDAQRKEVTAEASDFVDAVNGFCKIITEKLVANPKKTNGFCVETSLKNKITTYQSKVELERRKQEEQARRAAAELQAKLEAEAAEANRKAREEAERIAEEEARKKKATQAEIDAARKAAAAEAAKHEIQAPQVPAMLIPKQETVTRTETGASAFQKKAWKCTIIDESLVPRKYCVPSQKLLNEAARQGDHDIAGCKIEEVSSTNIRA